MLRNEDNMFESKGIPKNLFLVQKLQMPAQLKVT